jgi:hypothetical protein
MYTGNLINDLMATVERAESSIPTQPEAEFQLAYWYAVAQTDMANLDSGRQLAGVA